MNRNIPRTLILLLMVIIFALGVTGNVLAQAGQSGSSGQLKPVRFKPPEGYMTAEFPEKRPGVLLLNPKRPSGLFVVYPKPEEGTEVIPNLLKAMVAGMFFHDEKAQVAWTTAVLPAHEGISNETGTLYSASNDKLEIQLSVYSRTLGATTVLYGYYGMKHKGKKNKDDAPFIDASGKGVQDFDKLWKSIQESK